MRLLRRIALYLLITAVVLLGLGYALALKYGDHVKSFVVGEINKHLNTEVAIRDIRFSVIRNFPDASIVFGQVTARDAFVPKKPSSDTLFHAGTITLTFSLADIFSGNYTIKRIFVSDGTVNIRIDSRGRDNYHFWKASADTSSGSFSFNLRKVKLDNMALLYDNALNRHRYSLSAEEILFAGEFAGSNYHLNTQSKLLVHYIRSGDTYLIRQQPGAFDFDLEVKGDRYTIHKGSLSIADISLSSSGEFGRNKDHWEINLSFDAADTEIESLLSFFATDSSTFVKNYSSSGRFSCQGFVRGAFTASSFPSILLNFSVKDGALKNRSSGRALEKINLSGAYSNGAAHSLHTSTLDIASVNAVLEGQTLQGSIRLNDLSRPFVKASAQGTWDIGGILGLTGYNELEEISGTASCTLRYSGPVYREENSAHTEISAQAVLNNISFLLKGREVKISSLNGSLKYDGERLLSENLSFRAGESDFLVNGSLSNLVPGGTGMQQTILDASIHSESLDLASLLKSSTGEKSEDPDSTSYMPGRSTVRATITRLSYNKFSASSIRTVLSLHDSVLSVDNTSFQTMQGSVSLSGSMQKTSRDSFLLSCNGSLRKVNIRSLFTQMDNFGQNALRDENLNGNLTGTIQLYAMCSKDYQPDENKIYALANLTLENGELIDFEPMMALSKFIKVSELKNIRFATLSNQVEIRNRQIQIPSMEIKSNAFSLTASGTHGFDNQVEYRILMQLSGLLGKKAKEQNTEFGEVEDDGLGRISLPLVMRGDISDPRFSYDRATVAKKLKSDIKKEKETLRELLKEEFSWLRKKREPEPERSASAAEEPEADREDTPGAATPAPPAEEGKKKFIDRLKEKIQDPPER
jgi:hypothetical protein